MFIESILNLIPAPVFKLPVKYTLVVIKKTLKVVPNTNLFLFKAIKLSFREEIVVIAEVDSWMLKLLLVADVGFNLQLIEIPDVMERPESPKHTETGVVYTMVRVTIYVDVLPAVGELQTALPCYILPIG